MTRVLNLTTATIESIFSQRFCLVQGISCHPAICSFGELSTQQSYSRYVSPFSNSIFNLYIFCCRILQRLYFWQSYVFHSNFWVFVLCLCSLSIYTAWSGDYRCALILWVVPYLSLVPLSTVELLLVSLQALWSFPIFSSVSPHWSVHFFHSSLSSLVTADLISFISTSSFCNNFCWLPF